jgi:hypothetical protein
MGVPTSEVGYTSATSGRGDHEVHKGNAVALEEKHYRLLLLLIIILSNYSYMFNQISYKFNSCYMLAIAVLFGAKLTLSIDFNTISPHYNISRKFIQRKPSFLLGRADGMS